MNTTASSKLQVVANGDREIVITREFNAPRALVWRAMTEPALLKRWLGAFAGWTFEVCDIDLRVGGTYRYLWRGPDGMAMGMRGTYREIVPNERIVQTERFDEAWYPGEAVETAALTERDGRTTLTTTVVYDTKEARDGVLESPMATGMEAGYTALDALIASGLGE
jgi:uncharacterized protein YndB with AHSA1/START domain